MRLHQFQCHRKPPATNLRPTRCEPLNKGRASSGYRLLRTRGVQAKHHRFVALEGATGDDSHPATSSVSHSSPTILRFARVCVKHCMHSYACFWRARACANGYRFGRAGPRAMVQNVEILPNRLCGHVLEPFVAVAFRPPDTRRLRPAPRTRVCIIRGRARLCTRRWSLARAQAAVR